MRPRRCRSCVRVAALCAALAACAEQLPATPLPDAGAPAADRGSLADAPPADRRAPDGPAPVAAVDRTCTVDGCLRAVTLIGTYDRATVQAFLDPGLTIDNGYAVHHVVFFTDGSTSSATVTLPHDPAAPPSGGWHIVGNNHGTAGLADLCAPSASVEGAGLAGLFGTRGVIGVAVDYAGLGTPGPHPYLVSRVEGTSALDGLRAAAQLARLLGAPLSGRSALVGLSQGGHATLSAAALRERYAPELDVRAYGVAAPAAVWESQWSAGAAVAGPHVAYHAMALFAWAAHYGWPGPPLWSDTMGPAIDAIMADHCLWAASGPTIGSLVPEDPAQVFSAALLDEYRTRQWGAYAAVHDAFEKNAVRPFAASAPIRIYQGDADSVVPEPHTRELVQALRAGGMRIEYEVVPGGEHTTVAYGYLAFAQLRTDESIAWVLEQLE